MRLRRDPEKPHRRARRPAWIMGLLLVGSQLVSGSTSAQENEYDSLGPPVRDLLQQLQDFEVETVAVVDFIDLRGNVLELGRFLAEEVSVLLVREGKSLRVITRTRLNSLLAEHKLTPTGLVDPENTKKLGLISGVDVLVTGTTTPLTETVRVALQALDVETADIIAAAAADVRRTRAIDALLQREVQAGVGSQTSTGGVGEYQGKVVSQQIKYLAVYLRSFELLDGGSLRVTLDLRNTDPEGRGLALAWSAVGSGGIADYWKFFPRVEAVVTDNLGGSFTFDSASGPGFARTREDWLQIASGSEASIVVTLRRRDSGPVGEVFSFSAPIRLAWAEKGSQRVLTGEFNILLQDIRPTSRL